MRYRDQLREARRWSYLEAGFSEDLPPAERQEALERANALYEEAVRELEDIEAEEEENYSRFDRRFEKNQRRLDAV